MAEEAAAAKAAEDAAAAKVAEEATAAKAAEDAAAAKVAEEAAVARTVEDAAAAKVAEEATAAKAAEDAAAAKVAEEAAVARTVEEAAAAKAAEEAAAAMAAEEAAAAKAAEEAAAAKAAEEAAAAKAAEEAAAAKAAEEAAAAKAAEEAAAAKAAEEAAAAKAAEEAAAAKAAEEAAAAKVAEEAAAAKAAEEASIAKAAEEAAAAKAADEATAIQAAEAAAAKDVVEAGEEIWTPSKVPMLLSDEAREQSWSASARMSAQKTLSRASTFVTRLIDATDIESSETALHDLQAAASEAFGADAAAIADAVRSGGAMRALTQRINSPSVDVQLSALSLLGNLLTDVFDTPQSARQSLSLFVEAGGLPILQTKLSAEYPINLYAAATLQNVTSLDPGDTCSQLRQQGCETQLHQLLESDDATLVSYAEGVLANLRAHDPHPAINNTIDEAIRLRRLSSYADVMQEKRALSALQGAASRWLRTRNRAQSQTN